VRACPLFHAKTRLPLRLLDEHNARLFYTNCTSIPRLYLFCFYARRIFVNAAARTLLGDLLHELPFPRYVIPTATNVASRLFTNRCAFLLRCAFLSRNAVTAYRFFMVGADITHVILNWPHRAQPATLRCVYAAALVAGVTRSASRYLGRHLRRTRRCHPQAHYRGQTPPRALQTCCAVLEHASSAPERQTCLAHERAL